MSYAQLMRSIWLLLLAPVVAGCTAPTVNSPAAISTTPTLSCVGSVRDRVLPEWASAGFTNPTAPVTQVVGEHGDIIGVVFGQPLHAPSPAAGRGNKILWVANPGAPVVATSPTPHISGLLRIDATLEGSDLRAVKELPLGPSYVDMPRAGCWTFTLTWGGHRDRLAVPYDPS